MSVRHSCSHLHKNINIPAINQIIAKKDSVCDDCNYSGPKLWICLHPNCLRLGCSDQFVDHSTMHFNACPDHCVHMNISSRRIWCYKCNAEVFMDSFSELEQLESKDDGNDYKHSTTNQRDCYSNGMFVNNEESVKKSSGLNVGLEEVDEATDYSDNEDSEELNIDKPAGLVGLQNIGNTCYMNAALQALSNAPPLTRFFLDCPSVVQLLSKGKKPGLSRTYQVLMKDIWTKQTGGYVSASGILYGIRSVHPMFRGYHQHDTQEFLRNFMDQLHEELKQPCRGGGVDVETFSSVAMDEVVTVSSSRDSSEAEYETCDSGVSERSSLSDEPERKKTTSKRRLSRSTSPKRLRARIHNSNVIDCQPSASTSVQNTANPKKQVKYRSIISDVFDGKLLSSVQCLTCNRISSRVETFQDLSLPIPSKDHIVLLHGRGTLPGAMCSDALIPVQEGWISWFYNWLKSWFYGPMVTLHDCLAAFFSTDELKGDNMYSCEKCNKLRNGIKFSKVLQLPEILCIHLKRFRHELMFSSKISHAVNFPLKGLDMRPYLHKDCVSKVTTYDLFSVICHHGTAGGGHYVSYALNNNEWYEFDDQYVTSVSAEKVENCEAYVLFYRKSAALVDDIRLNAVKLAEMCGDEMESAYLSKQWINRFNTCTEPGPIDNSDFLCQHGSINADQILILDHLSVRVPLAVYDYLHKVYGGCPPITCVHVCSPCQALSKRLLSEMETFVQLTNEAQNENCQSTHLLSLDWFNQWHNFVNKKTSDPPGPIDNSKIDIDRIDPNNGAPISEEIWNFFFEIYGGGPEIRLSNPRNFDNETPENETEDNEIEFVIPNLKKKQCPSLNNVEMTEVMEPTDNEEKMNEESDKEGDQDTLDATLTNGENEPNSNLISSKSLNCLDDNEAFDCKNNNVEISHNLNRRKITMWLDSN